MTSSDWLLTPPSTIWGLWCWDLAAAYAANSEDAILVLNGGFTDVQPRIICRRDVFPGWRDL
jgi:hypothetical protein